MSRMIIGICILLLLLAVCSSFSLWMPKIHLDISGQLAQAAQSARQGNWQQASALAEQAAQAWENIHILTTVASDHGPIDEINALFAELAVYASRQETAEFAAAAARLSCLTAAMGKNHGFSLGNLL